MTGYLSYDKGHVAPGLWYNLSVGLVGPAQSCEAKPGHGARNMETAL